MAFRYRLMQIDAANVGLAADNMDDAELAVLEAKGIRTIEVRSFENHDAAMAWFVEYCKTLAAPGGTPTVEHTDGSEIAQAISDRLLA